MLPSTLGLIGARRGEGGLIWHRLIRRTTAPASTSLPLPLPLPLLHATLALPCPALALLHPSLALLHPSWDATGFTFAASPCALAATATRATAENDQFAQFGNGLGVL